MCVFCLYGLLLAALWLWHLRSPNLRRLYGISALRRAVSHRYRRHYFDLRCALLPVHRRASLLASIRPHCRHCLLCSIHPLDDRASRRHTPLGAIHYADLTDSRHYLVYFFGYPRASAVPRRVEGHHHRPCRPRAVLRLLQHGACPRRRCARRSVRDAASAGFPFASHIQAPVLHASAYIAEHLLDCKSRHRLCADR